MVAHGRWRETEALAARFKRGERELLWQIVGRLDPLVRRSVERVLPQPYWAEEDDLIQAGTLEAAGLLEEYEPARNGRIDAYMNRWLYYRLLRWVEKAGPVGMPAFRSSDELEERAAHFLSPGSYEPAGEVPPERFVSEEVGFREVEWEDFSRRSVDTSGLSDRELYVLRHRFGLDGVPPMTLVELSRELGVSPERVRVIQEMALVRARPAAALRDGIPVGDAPEAERSVSAVGEWPGELVPLAPVGRTGYRPPKRRPRDAVVSFAVARVAEFGVVGMSEIREGRFSIGLRRRKISSMLERSGFEQVSPGYWTVRLTPAVCAAAGAVVRTSGPMRPKELLDRLLRHADVDPWELPSAPVLGALLGRRFDFVVDGEGVVHAGYGPTTVLERSGVGPGRKK